MDQRTGLARTKAPGRLINLIVLYGTLPSLPLEGQYGPVRAASPAFSPWTGRADDDERPNKTSKSWKIRDTLAAPTGRARISPEIFQISNQ